MMRKMMWAGLIAAIVCHGSVALADDLVAPPWRGDPGSTYQEWDFLTNSDPAAPEVDLNTYGTASADISLGPLASGYWATYPPIVGGRIGVWDIATGDITLTIPNTDLTGPATWKEIWVQVTYYQDITTIPVVEVVGGSFLGGQTITSEVIPAWGSYVVTQSMWRIEPNPTIEEIIISGDPVFGSMIDQIVVDTICIPEPATLSLLALGGLAVLVRRRRQEA